MLWKKNFWRKTSRVYGSDLGEGDEKQSYHQEEIDEKDMPIISDEVNQLLEKLNNGNSENSEDDN